MEQKTFESDFDAFNALDDYLNESGFEDATMDDVLALVKKGKVDVSWLALPEKFRTFDDFIHHMDLVNNALYEIHLDAWQYGCRSPFATYQLRTIKEHHADTKKYKFPDCFRTFDEFAEYLRDQERKTYGDIGEGVFLSRNARG